MGDYNHMINIILSIISIASIESSSNDSSLIESSSIESSSIESIVFFDYDNKIINFDNSHIKDIEFIKNDKLVYYELFELYYNLLFRDLNKYISIINYKNYLNDFNNYYKLNIKQLKLLFSI